MQQQRRSPQLQGGQAGLLESMLRAGAGSTSPPPMPQGVAQLAGGPADGGSRPSQGPARQAGTPARKHGAQHVPKPVPGRENRWVGRDAYQAGTRRDTWALVCRSIAAFMPSTGL